MEAVCDGYNAVMFMYGQTASGKTFTLFGEGSGEGGVTGVVDLCLKH